jgi:TonB-linked SusC/RagA family outer membrane protein
MMKKIQNLKLNTYFPKWAGKVIKRPYRMIGLTFLFLSLSYMQVIAQKTVSGTVVGQNGPLHSATVQVKGTKNSTVTDAGGKYSIGVSNDKSVLVFSYTGYSTEEVAVGNRTLIDVTISIKQDALDEVVVVGYGKKKRGELTGSVSTINADKIEKSSGTNLTKSLAGLAPGLIVNDRGGYPGAGDADAVSILIRGKATLNNNAPLIVVDGVPTNSLSFLAPGDIASITVLKDGAAAIYGARAANGVLLVTTKRGRSGKPSFSFTASNTQSAFTRVPRYMDSWQYATYRNEIDTRYGNPLQFTADDISKYLAGNDPINYPNTNWYDLTMKKWSSESRFGISASGGSEFIKYFFSANSFTQGGMFRSGDLSFRQHQLRGNLDFKINKFLNFGVDFSGISGKTEQPGSNIGRIYKHLTVDLPTSIGQYPNGLYGVGAENGNNPRVMSSNASGFDNTTNSELRTRFTANLDLSYLLKGLSANGSATFTLRNADEKLFHNTWATYRYNKTTDKYDFVPGFDFTTGNFLSVQDGYNKYTEEYYSGQLNYARTFGKHSIGAFVAFEQTTGVSKQFSAYKRDLVSANHPDLFSGSDAGAISTGSASEFGRLNYFGSISYDFQKKYLVDITLRRDGSSNFAKGKEFGTFPSVSAGWVISKEGFMKGTQNWLDFLKIRASWASLGNDRVPAFQYLTRYNFGGLTSNVAGVPNAAYGNYYIFGESPSRTNTFISANVPNPDITWEKAELKNIGLNFAILKNKLTGDVNYFYQKRTDILVQRAASIPAYAALTLPQENIGKVDNYGYELELNYKDKKGKLNYYLGGNFTNAKNKVKYLAEPANIPAWQKQEGYPIDSYIIYPSNGIFIDQADVDKTLAKLVGTKPGDVKYIDTDGDGKITSNDQIRKYASAVPQIQYGITGGVEYKGIELNFLFQGQAKAAIPILFDNEGSRPQFLFDNRWTPDNTSAKYPRAFVTSDVFNAKLSDVWLQNASFIRLKNIEVAYTIPNEIISYKNVFSGMRIFVRGTNLITFDKIKYLDPEASQYTTGDTFGNGSYTPLKTVTVGANIHF